MVFSFLCSACAPQKYVTVEAQAFSLTNGDLAKYGVAFITPSTVTGQEQDIQSLALSFSNLMKELRPEINIMPLSDTLSMINRNGMIEDYKKMYRNYSDTGIFDQDIIRKISKVTGRRYLAQLKLSEFTQETSTRFSFGFRIIDTKKARMRLFFQIWDSHNGTIAWEGSAELNYSYDTVTNNAINFKTVVQITAIELVKNMPR
ncbi:hypothetical protein MNBD_GAMMA22-1350 [hydrothermal vent metagenome]|uniref:Lipoprotein n=1 Tax=hydrothermal vent metagenome TaxID=652676 RepID=A0A3B1AXW1_9ZZZZ